MAGLSLDHPWAFTIGILGNIISLMVFLAPLPTFYRMYTRKSTEGFQSVPYVVALFSCMLWFCYAFLKTDAYLLITINSIGCAIETVYIVIYLTYAPKVAKIFTAKLVLLVNVGMFGLILLLTLLLAEGSKRVGAFGWICVSFSVSVFVAPLSVIRLVMRTKSVEFMPVSLSFFLTLSAIVWFAYGLLTKDIYVGLPNVVGFIFGILQMVLYVAYRDKNRVAIEHKLPEHIISIAKLSAEKASEIYPIDSATPVVHDQDKVGNEGQKEQEQGGGAEEAKGGMAAPQRENEANSVEV
ncbi:bidirectional sugar transporter SWEET14-like [Musa acuminata AAA Group]|uniref:bidirectional sugar transporter SWEET14-like n=1 Tax=Musa acuminata AAA Group TaxID=214697 RepID=UPI0031D0DF12